MQDLEEIRKITGVCPQFNVQFDMLTVKENLRLFAKIKGIQPKDVEEKMCQRRGEGDTSSATVGNSLMSERDPVK